MQLRSKITVARNIRIQHHVKRKAQNAVVLGLEVADGMVKTTFKQLEKRFNFVVHGIRFLSEHLDLLEHRATTSAGKPVSILRVKAEKKFRPSFPIGSLQL